MLYFHSLKKIRKEKKIKLKDIATFLGKSRNTIPLWEKGKFQPTDAEIRLMAQYLGVSVSEISDLQELKINNDNLKKQDTLDLEIGDLPQDVAVKLKTLHNSCLDLSATNTRLRSTLFKYETMLQNLPFIIYVKDNKLKYTYINEQFLNLIGRSYSKDSISGTSSFEIFGIKEYSQILELEKKVLTTKQRINNHQIYIPGTYRQKIGLLTIIPILDDNKEVEEVVSSIEDISDTYEEEAKRKDLEAITSKTNHMVWIGEETNPGISDSFKYTFVSDNISEIFGVEKEIILKDNSLWFKIIHPDDIEAVTLWRAKTIFPKRMKYKINNPKKGVRWIFTEVFKESMNKFYGITTDVTEEKEREQEKDAILKTLDAASDAIKIAKIKDNNKEYIYVNRANKNLYELPITKIKNNPDLWKELLYPADKDKMLTIDNEHREGHLHFFYRLSFPGGKIKYIEEDMFREVIDGVLYSGTIKRDITEKKKKRHLT